MVISLLQKVNIMIHSRSQLSIEGIVQEGKACTEEIMKIKYNVSLSWVLTHRCARHCTKNRFMCFTIPVA